MPEWIPALEGMEARLQAGASVADVGCGHGASTLIMAQAYPASRFHGFDYHEPSIRYAREAAQRAGVADRVTFDVATAKDFDGGAYDGGRVRLPARHGRSGWRGGPCTAGLAPDGAWMIVEPFANDRLEDNLTPIGRVFYSASTFICTPASRSQEVGLCPRAGRRGAHARSGGGGGFTRFRRAAETPFNLIYEARP